MQVALSLSLCQPSAAPAPSGAIAAPFASVRGTGENLDYSNGWAAEYAGTPTVSSPIAFTVLRQGYTTAAATTTFRDTFYVTTRVRQPYPNTATPQATKVALSDFIYSTDTVDGTVTNSSTLTSPKPICNWVMPHRATVANSIDLELVAHHRNARGGSQVAAVKFIATDGTTTVSQVVSAYTKSARATDLNAVCVYACTLDISTLTAANPGLVTVNAEVYPWVGDVNAVCKSADSAVAREFSPRYFYRNTTLAASPFYAYVKTGGTSGGIYSTTAATAAATPFDTIANALNSLNSGAAGKGDNVIIRLGDDGGTPWALLGPTTSRNQNCGYLTITRDPTVARANARIGFAASFRARMVSTLLSPLTTGCIRFNDVQINRTSTSATFTGEAANQLEVILEDVTFDNGSASATWLSNSHDYWYGAVIQNCQVASGLGAATYEHRCWRGVSLDAGNAQGMDGWLVIGSNISATSSMGCGTRSEEGSIVAFNQFRKASSTNNVWERAATVSLTTRGVAFDQNLIEVAHATASTGATGPSRDTPVTGSTYNVLMRNNTTTGFTATGRQNHFYDNTVATHRNHTLLASKGNIWDQINTKSDQFVTDGTFLGNYAYLYSAGCQGEFTQWIDSSGGGLNTSFAQAYYGRGSNYGTSLTTRNDPLFTDYEGTTGSGGVPIAGAGGGTYTLQGGSPAKAIVETAAFPFDLAGTARPATNDSAGAYA